jgi:hypothetical protein
MAVLDIDRKDDKDGFTAQSDAGLDRFTDGCYVVAPPSGGRHIYFAHFDSLRSSTSKIAEGVDVRADGGYVIAPGAVTPKGRHATSGKSNDIIAKTFPK